MSAPDVTLAGCELDAANMHLQSQDETVLEGVTLSTLRSSTCRLTELQEHMDSWLQTDSQADSQTTVTGILHVLLQCLVEDRAEQRDEVAEMRRDLGMYGSLASELSASKRDFDRALAEITSLFDRKEKFEDQQRSTLSAVVSQAEQNRLGVAAVEAALPDLYASVQLALSAATPALRPCRDAKEQPVSLEIEERPTAGVSFQQPDEDRWLRLDCLEKDMLRAQGQLDNVEEIQEHMHVAVTELHSVASDCQAASRAVSALELQVMRLEEKLTKALPPSWSAQEDVLATIQESDTETELSEHADPSPSNSHADNSDSSPNLCALDPGSRTSRSSPELEAMWARLDAMEEQLDVMSNDTTKALCNVAHGLLSKVVPAQPCNAVYPDGSESRLATADCGHVFPVGPGTARTGTPSFQREGHEETVQLLGTINKIVETDVVAVPESRGSEDSAALYWLGEPLHSKGGPATGEPCADGGSNAVTELRPPILPTVSRTPCPRRATSVGVSAQEDAQYVGLSQGSALLSRSAHVAEQWQKNLAPLLHRATNINLELRPGNMAIDHEVTLNEEREHEQARKVELTMRPRGRTDSATTTTSSDGPRGRSESSATTTASSGDQERDDESLFDTVSSEGTNHCSSGDSDDKPRLACQVGLKASVPIVVI